LNGQPYEVLDSSLSFRGRGSSVLQTKIKNLITGNVISKTFHTGEEFEEAEIEKIRVKFIYHNKGKFFFCYENDHSKRFDLAEEAVGFSAVFLKPDETVEGLQFKGKIINISLPIKVKLKVIEAPPGIKGDRAQGGTKVVKLETGAEINAPLFIEAQDIIEINTEKGEYVRRVE